MDEFWVNFGNIFFDVVKSGFEGVFEFFGVFVLVNRGEVVVNCVVIVVY
jgi:hypothetical protein